MNTEVKRLTDQRLPWQKEGYVDPFAEYERLKCQAFGEIIKELFQTLKPKTPKVNWIEEGF